MTGHRAASLACASAKSGRERLAQGQQGRDSEAGLFLFSLIVCSLADALARSRKIMSCGLVVGGSDAALVSLELDVRGLAPDHCSAYEERRPSHNQCDRHGCKASLEASLASSRKTPRQGRYRTSSSALVFSNKARSNACRDDATEMAGRPTSPRFVSCIGGSPVAWRVGGWRVYI